eukprot:15205707-Ditylum_brightwellii.AAC.2
MLSGAGVDMCENGDLGIILGMTNPPMSGFLMVGMGGHLGAVPLWGLIVVGFNTLGGVAVGAT